MHSSDQPVGYPSVGRPNDPFQRFFDYPHTRISQSTVQRRSRDHPPHRNSLVSESIARSLVMLISRATLPTPPFIPSRSGSLSDPPHGHNGPAASQPQGNYIAQAPSVKSEQHEIKLPLSRSSTKRQSSSSSSKRKRSSMSATSSDAGIERSSGANGKEKKKKASRACCHCQKVSLLIDVEAVIAVC